MKRTIFTIAAAVMLPVFVHASTPASLDLTLTRDITFGPIVIVCKDSAGTVVNVTGWTAYAEVRKKPEDTTAILNLAPVVSNGAAGEVTIPAIANSTTKTLPAGAYLWDFILQKPTGERLGPFISGRFIIGSKITQP